MSRAHARIARSRRRTDQATLILLIAFLIVSCITAILGIFWVRNLVLSRSANPAAQGPAAVQSEFKDIDNPGESVPAPIGPLQRDIDPTPIPWDGTSRVTILIMGLDFRDWSAGDDIPRTDSMILVSIDPVFKTVGMLSIPRDMWVSVPGMGYNKINTAYRWGEAYALPGGGPGLAMKTVEDFIGLPVNYYALIDFNAFVGIIDEMGGLDMHIREEIVVDPIGPNNTVTLEPGVQTLDGATVLAYARQRSTGNDDFDRAKRQQEVIMAIRNQVLQFNMLPTLVAKAPKLYRDIASGISTNLTLDQIIRLALLGAQVDEGNIKKGVISPPDQVTIATNPEDGQSILIPVPDQIRILRDKIFSSKPTARQTAQKSTPNAPGSRSETPSPQVDPAEQMKVEKARVVVMNGTSAPGLASKTSQMLKAMGINVIEEDNADSKLNITTIYDYTGKPFTIEFMIERLNLPNARVENRYDPNASADIIIVLGADWASQQ